MLKETLELNDYQLMLLERAIEREQESIQKQEKVTPNPPGVEVHRLAHEYETLSKLAQSIEEKRASIGAAEASL
jgi:hypothetical protein